MELLRVNDDDWSDSVWYGFEKLSDPLQHEIFSGGRHTDCGTHGRRSQLLVLMLNFAEEIFRDCRLKMKWMVIGCGVSEHLGYGGDFHSLATTTTQQGLKHLEGSEERNAQHAASAKQSAPWNVLSIMPHPLTLVSKLRRITTSAGDPLPLSSKSIRSITEILRVYYSQPHEQTHRNELLNKPLLQQLMRDMMIILQEANKNMSSSSCPRVVATSSSPSDISNPKKRRRINEEPIESRVTVDTITGSVPYRASLEHTFSSSKSFSSPQAHPDSLQESLITPNIFLLLEMLIIFFQDDAQNLLMDHTSTWMPVVECALSQSSFISSFHVTSCYKFLNMLFYQNAEICRWFIDRYSSLIYSHFFPTCIPNSKAFISTSSNSHSSGVSQHCFQHQTHPIFFLSLSILSTMLNYGLRNLLPRKHANELCWRIFETIMRLLEIGSARASAFVSDNSSSHITGGTSSSAGFEMLPGILRTFLEAQDVVSGWERISPNAKKHQQNYKRRIEETTMEAIPLLCHYLEKLQDVKHDAVDANPTSKRLVNTSSLQSYILSHSYLSGSMFGSIGSSTWHFNAPSAQHILKSNIFLTLATIVRDNEEARQNLLICTPSPTFPTHSIALEQVAPQKPSNSPKNFLKSILTSIQSDPYTRFSAVSLVRNLSRAQLNVRSVLVNGGESSLGDDEEESASGAKTKPTLPIPIYEALGTLLICDCAKNLSRGVEKISLPQNPSSHMMEDVESELPIENLPNADTEIMIQIIATLSNFAMDFGVVKAFLCGTISGEPSHASASPSGENDSSITAPSLPDSPFLQRLDELARFGISPTLRRNAVWTLKNIAYQASLRVKEAIIHNVPLCNIFEMMHSSEESVVVEAVNLLRNLVAEDQMYINTLLDNFGNELIRELDGKYKKASSTETDLLIQLNYLVSNLLAGQTLRQKERILTENILHKIVSYCKHTNYQVVSSSLWALLNYCWSSEKENGDTTRLLQIDGFMSQVERLSNMSALSSVPSSTLPGEGSGHSTRESGEESIDNFLEEGSDMEDQEMSALPLTALPGSVATMVPSSSQLLGEIRNKARQLKQLISAELDAE
mmetsp:Transcript_6449/g.24182  ORF Transcript_6449/g.24182 Transcript_6449/m.24182 type:complete len:1082 (-) Transcript_6449:1058-4303(-)